MAGAALTVALLPALLAASPASASSAGSGTTAATMGSTVTTVGGTSTPSAGASGPARVVRFHGYAIRVPASWPVYRLAGDAARCVLFNRHAVYLGTPGADERCPARAFGRTEALLVQPEPGSAHRRRGYPGIRRAC